MRDKRFTAQEMREVAEGLVDSCIADNISILVGHGNLKVVKGDRIVAILRYAAEVLGRCAESRLNFHSCPAERNIIDYIIRGNSGKEEK